MTNQEILDKVIAHARQQKCRAIGKNGFCLYRTNDGKKCFIGALIPDELYDSKMETVVPVNIEGMDKFEISKHNFIINDALYSIGIKQESVPFLLHLQNIHDDEPLEPEDWEKEFKIIAEEYELIYTPLQVENNE